MENIESFKNTIKKVNKFEGLYKVFKNLSSKQKGDFFEYFTFYMFKLDPRLNNDIQNIWMYKDIPDKIKKELKLPVKDMGIDLLLQKNDKYYSIQCKFRQEPETAKIKWYDAATFVGLSFGMTDNITAGYFVTNTYEVNAIVANSEKLTSIYGDFFDDLPENFFENIRNSIDKKKLTKYILMKPHAHQKIGIGKAKKHFKKNSRGNIIMACGSGKTMTVYWIDEILENETTLILVPALHLLSQFFSSWICQSFAQGKTVNYITVGSDGDVTDEVKEKCKILFETNPDEIAKLIKKMMGNKLVVICYISKF